MMEDALEHARLLLMTMKSPARQKQQRVSARHAAAAPCCGKTTAESGRADTGVNLTATTHWHTEHLP